VVRHLIDSAEAAGMEIHRIVDLQPTSPLRLSDDIEAALRLLDTDTDLVITGYPAESNPYFSMVEAQSDGTVTISKELDAPIARRQDAPTVYAMNGSIYCWRRESFRESLWDGRVKIYVMPRERSVDIDDEMDWKIAELLIAEREASHAR
jgi:CMP-N-acetylneuraminic acid synthetase